MRGGGQRGIRVSTSHPAPAQHVAGRMIVQIGLPAGGLELHDAERFPGDREVGVGDAEDRLGVAHQRAHRLAAMPHQRFGQHGLILAGRVDAVQVPPRNIRCGQHPDQSGMGRQQWAKVADAEAGVGVRAAHRPHRQPCLGRQRIRAEFFRPGHLARAIDLLDPRTHAMAHVRSGARPRCEIQHRLDDLAVAGAAAQHAAERILHLRLARGGDAGEQVGRRHQHRRSADAALRRAVPEKCLLQRRQSAILGRQPLDGRHRPSLDARHRDQAGAALPTVEQNRAGAAIPGVAADLGAGQPQIVAQHVREAPDRVGMQRPRLPVEREAERVVRRPHAAISSAQASRAIARRTSSRPALRR